MVGVFVTFHYDDGVDTGAVTRIAEAAGANFRGMRGLRADRRARRQRALDRERTATCPRGPRSTTST
jgi:hypothetical protein